jgi:hypothetical protein
MMNRKEEKDTAWKDIYTTHHVLSSSDSFCFHTAGAEEVAADKEAQFLTERKNLANSTPSKQSRQD